MAWQQTGVTTSGIERGLDIDSCGALKHSGWTGVIAHADGAGN